MLAWVEAPAVVRQAGAILRVTMGERRGGSSPRLEALARVLREAGVEAAVSGDVEAAAWEKLAFIAAFGGVGAVTRAWPRSCPRRRRPGGPPLVERHERVHGVRRTR
jgi:2-dehydropantoate 2-reductase